MGENRKERGQDVTTLLGSCHEYKLGNNHFSLLPQFSSRISLSNNRDIVH